MSLWTAKPEIVPIDTLSYSTTLWMLSLILPKERTSLSILSSGSFQAPCKRFRKTWPARTTHLGPLVGRPVDVRYHCYEHHEHPWPPLDGEACGSLSPAFKVPIGLIGLDCYPGRIPSQEEPPHANHLQESRAVLKLPKF